MSGPVAWAFLEIAPAKRYPICQSDLRTIASNIQDRLTHRCTMLEFEDKSYRREGA